MPALTVSNAVFSKIKFLFLPYLCVTVGLVTFYSFLHWLLLIKLELFQIDYIYVEFWIPAALPVVPIILYFRQKLKVLAFARNEDSRLSIYYLFLWLSMAFSLGTTQNFLEKATGKLSKLNDVTRIYKNQPSKYYMLKQHYVHKKDVGIYKSVNVSGKHNKDFNMNIYIVMPILPSVGDTNNTSGMAWLAKGYHKTISNKVPEWSKKMSLQTFEKESTAEYWKEAFDDFAYLERPKFSRNVKAFEKALLYSPYYRFENRIILEGVKSPFRERLGKSVEWMVGSFAIGCFLWLIMIIIPDVR